MPRPSLLPVGAPLEQWLQRYASHASLKDLALSQRDVLAVSFPRWVAHDGLSVSRHSFLVPSVDMAALAARLTQTVPSAPSTSVVYDVIRCRAAGPLFAQEHFQRFHRSLKLHFTAKEPTTAEEAKEAAAAELTSIAQELVSVTCTAQSDSSIEQNVMLIAWSVHQGGEEKAEGSGGVASAYALATFFRSSSYPPAAWYTDGCTCALLYDAMRENPNAKVEHAALRQRAAAQQQALQCYESFMVHHEPDLAGMKVTEGSRSNLIAVIPTAVDSSGDEHHNLRSLDVCCAQEKDILVGVTLLGIRKVMQEESSLWHIGTIVHRDLTVEDIVLNAKALAMTGTSVGVLPINRLVVFSNEQERKQFLKSLNMAEDLAEAELSEAMRKANVAYELVSKEDGSRIGVVSKDSSTNAAIVWLIEKYNESAYASSH